MLEYPPSLVLLALHSLVAPNKSFRDISCVTPDPSKTANSNLLADYEQNPSGRGLEFDGDDKRKVILNHEIQDLSERRRRTSSVGAGSPRWTSWQMASTSSSTRALLQHDGTPSPTLNVGVNSDRGDGNLKTRGRIGDVDGDHKPPLLLHRSRQQRQAPPRHDLICNPLASILKPRRWCSSTRRACTKGQTFKPFRHCSLSATAQHTPSRCCCFLHLPPRRRDGEQPVWPCPQLPACPSPPESGSSGRPIEQPLDFEPRHCYLISFEGLRGWGGTSREEGGEREEGSGGGCQGGETH